MSRATCSRRLPAAAAALLLLALAALGCASSPTNDEGTVAIEEPTPTTGAAQPVEQTQRDSQQATTQPTTAQPDPPVTTTQSDPSTTTEHDEPEEPTSQPDQTGPSETVTDGDTPGVGADDAPPQPFKDINRAVWPQFAHALLPWGDGFLQYGYAASGARHWHCQLVIRYLADGLTWSDFEALPVPFSGVLVSDACDDSIRAAASDGQRLLFVVQQDNRILVSITGDLTNWDTIEIVPPPTDGLPHGVRAETLIGGLAIGPDGWLLHTSTSLGVDLWVLAPADIRESAHYIRFGFPESQGLNVEWKTEQQEPGESYFSRFVTWEELGIDEDTYLHYGAAEYLMRPHTPAWLRSHEVWSANWGQEPIRAELPEVRGAVGWQIDGTDAGYVGLPVIGKPGTVVVEHPMFFSSDGLGASRGVVGFGVEPRC